MNVSKCSFLLFPDDRRKKKYHLNTTFSPQEYYVDSTVVDTFISFIFTGEKKSKDFSFILFKNFLPKNSGDVYLKCKKPSAFLCILSWRENLAAALPHLKLFSKSLLIRHISV